MNTLTVALPGREYNILIQRGLLAQAGARCRAVLPQAKKLALVSDSNVAPLYGQTVLESLAAAGFEARLFVIPAGEVSKNAGQLSQLWEDFMEFGLTRTDAVAALGGGVVGDLTGFAAATILRGVDFVQIPTTLLAQVDSSVGGKVAIDLKAGKNLAGAFYQPRLVLMDPDVLDTLPDAVFSDGMAEVIKYGCIWDRAFFDFLAAHPSRAEIMAEIEYVLYTCCDIKRQVVIQDERDTGLRMILNFGHTLGHAYELAGGYVDWSHGEAVAAGMCAAAQMGVVLGLTPPDVPGRIESVCVSFGLPAQISCTADDYAAAIGLDKKGSGADISLIVLTSVGHAAPHALPKARVLELLEALPKPKEGVSAMNITITPTKLKGAITPPPSKSQAHRLIIAAALAGGESVISNVAYSQDIEATIGCMEQLGAQFVREGSTLTVRGLGANAMSPLRKIAPPRLDCGESGSTLRFLIPVVLAVCGGGVFTGHGRLMERPQQPYFDLFDQKGIFYQQKDGVLTVSGRLSPGEYQLPGNVSSQFLSGLMFALPLLEGDSAITLTSPLESGDYVELTRDVLRTAGVLTDRGRIPGRQLYHPIRQTVEADWSQAAFFYAAHGLGSNLLIQGLSPFSTQADTRIVPFYMELCSSDEDVALDVSQCPDLFPALALLAALRDGKVTNIGGAARLRLKESDRISAVTEVLRAFGVPVEEFPDGIALSGVGALAGNVTIDCHNDHRIAMMAAMAATRADGPVTLTGAECVAKSYPNFWDDYESLGGQIVKGEGAS